MPMIQNSFFNIHSRREPINLRRDTNDIALIEKEGDTYLENKQFERAIAEYNYAKKVIQEQIGNFAEGMGPSIETLEAIKTIENLMNYRDALYEKLDKKISFANRQQKYEQSQLVIRDMQSKPEEEWNAKADAIYQFYIGKGDCQLEKGNVHEAIIYYTKSKLIKFCPEKLSKEADEKIENAKVYAEKHSAKNVSPH